MKLRIEDHQVAAKGVAVAIPTYRHAVVFEWMLKSVLTQEIEELTVFIFDNGKADNFVDIEDVIKSINDTRVRYSPNLTNIGSRANYLKCFSALSNFEFGMVLSADMALAKGLLKYLLGRAQTSNLGAVFPKTRLVELPEELPQNTDLSRSILEPNFGQEAEYLSSIELLAEFFGELNSEGQYSRFSFLGALAAGEIFSHLATIRTNYRFHGWEFTYSMNMADKANKIALLGDIGLFATVGLRKFGTERPLTDWTRLEPILATYQMLCEIRSKDMGIGAEIDYERYRKDHLARLSTYVKNYGDFAFLASAMKWIVINRIYSKTALGVFVRFALKSLDFRERRKERHIFPPR